MSMSFFISGEDVIDTDDIPDKHDLTIHKKDNESRIRIEVETGELAFSYDQIRQIIQALEVFLPPEGE